LHRAVDQYLSSKFRLPGGHRPDCLASATHWFQFRNQSLRRDCTTRRRFHCRRAATKTHSQRTAIVSAAAASCWKQ